jgi:hypothetical protein
MCLAQGHNQTNATKQDGMGTELPRDFSFPNARPSTFNNLSQSMSIFIFFENQQTIAYLFIKGDSQKPAILSESIDFYLALGISDSYSLICFPFPSQQTLYRKLENTFLGLNGETSAKLIEI